MSPETRQFQCHRVTFYLSIPPKTRSGFSVNTAKAHGIENIKMELQLFCTYKVVPP